MQNCWDSSGREMERGADILIKKFPIVKFIEAITASKKSRDDAYVDEEGDRLTVEFDWYKIKELEADAIEFLNKFLEGKPRYSIEELKAISEHLINEGRIEGQAIKGLHDLAWFISKNPEKVKQILEAN